MSASAVAANDSQGRENARNARRIGGSADRRIGRVFRAICDDIDIKIQERRYCAVFCRPSLEESDEVLAPIAASNRSMIRCPAARLPANYKANSAGALFPVLASSTRWRLQVRILE